MEIIKEKNKILIVLEGKEIGKITWFENDEKLVVDHTYVNPDYRGNNYAKVLVDEIVKFARSENKKINPVCPYVDKVLSRDEKYSDVLEKDDSYSSCCML